MMRSDDTRTCAAAPRWMREPIGLFLWVAALHVAVRAGISPALKWDEAEQVVDSQHLLLGYGPQPPLYTWLQWAVNELLGPGALAVALLKHTLLACAYALMWLAARRLLPTRAAFWAAAGMVLMPPMGWDTVRDQTHTVLLVTMVAGLVWAIVRQVQRPSPGGFALIGAFIGGGLLAKYNHALVVAALAASALSLPRPRAALTGPGWWLAPLVAVLVVLPHGLWLATHLQDASAETLHKMQGGAPRPWTQGVVAGLASLGGKLAGALLLPLLVVLGVFGLRPWRAPPAAPADDAQTAWAAAWLTRYLALVLAMLVAMVLVARVGHFAQRWLMPLLMVVPLTWLLRRPWLADDPRAPRLDRVLIAVAAIILVAAGLRPWMAARSGQPDELNHPIVALAARLPAHGYDGRGPVVAADHMLAGMLRARFPQVAVTDCDPQFHAALAACLERSVGAGPRTGTLLLIERADRPAGGGWWPQAMVAIGQPAATAPHALRLPWDKAPAGLPPATYRLWVAPP